MATETTTTKPSERGTVWLADLVNEKLGTEYTSYQIRILLRKLIKEGTIEREEGRYQFRGERDPKVLAVIKAAKAGDLDVEKKTRIAAIKAAPVEEDEAPPTRRRSSRAKAAPVEEDEDIDLDEI